MNFSFGSFKLHADVEKTREYYRNAEKITDGCNCDGCTNFEKAIAFFPKNVKDFFAELGIDTKKADDVFVCCSKENGAKLLYLCRYYLYGTLLSAPSAYEWKQADKGTFVGRPIFDNFFTIAEGYRAAFTEEIKILALETEFLIPWVLDKPNTYN